MSLIRRRSSSIERSIGDMGWLLGKTARLNVRRLIPPPPSLERAASPRQLTRPDEPRDGVAQVEQAPELAPRRGVEVVPAHQRARPDRHRRMAVLGLAPG